MGTTIHLQQTHRHRQREEGESILSSKSSDKLKRDSVALVKDHELIGKGLQVSRGLLAYVYIHIHLHLFFKVLISITMNGFID